VGASDHGVLDHVGWWWWWWRGAINRYSLRLINDPFQSDFPMRFSFGENETIFIPFLLCVKIKAKPKRYACGIRKTSFRWTASVWKPRLKCKGSNA
jgi:hypothetical protein